jgi:hypothetical protein
MAIVVDHKNQSVDKVERAKGGTGIWLQLFPPGIGEGVKLATRKGYLLYLFWPGSNAPFSIA